MSKEPRRSLRLHPVPPPLSQQTLNPLKREYIEISSPEPSNLPRSSTLPDRGNKPAHSPSDVKLPKSKKKKHTRQSSLVKKLVDVAVGPDEASTPTDNLDEVIQIIKDTFGQDFTCPLCRIPLQQQD